MPRRARAPARSRAARAKRKESRQAGRVTKRGRARGGGRGREARTWSSEASTPDMAEREGVRRERGVRVGMGGCVYVVRRACGCAASNGYFSDVIYFRARRTHSCASARSVLAHAQTSLRHDVRWRVVGVASARSFSRGGFDVGRVGTRGEGARRLRRARASSSERKNITRPRYLSTT